MPRPGVTCADAVNGAASQAAKRARQQPIPKTSGGQGETVIRPRIGGREFSCTVQ
jgi:hypothetical protein